MRMIPVAHFSGRMARWSGTCRARPARQIELDTSGGGHGTGPTIVEELADPWSTWSGIGWITASRPASRARPRPERIRRTHSAARRTTGADRFVIGGLGRWPRAGPEKVLAQGTAERAGGRGGDRRRRSVQPDFRAGLLDRGRGHRRLRPRRRNGCGAPPYREVARRGSRSFGRGPRHHVPAEAAADAGDHRWAGGRSRRERYIVPLLRCARCSVPGRISFDSAQKDEMALVRGSLLPVVRLYRRFGVRRAVRGPLRCGVDLSRRGRDSDSA